MRCRGSQQPKLSKYIVLPWYKNAPDPNRRSFAGKMDKICPKTSKRLKPEGKYTSLCSAHFKASCYNFPNQLEGIEMNRILKKRISTNG